MSASVPVFRAARLVPALLLLSVACGRTAPAPDPQLVAQWTRSSLAFVRTDSLLLWT